MHTNTNQFLDEDYFIQEPKNLVEYANLRNAMEYYNLISDEELDWHADQGAQRLNFENDELSS